MSDYQHHDSGWRVTKTEEAEGIVKFRQAGGGFMCSMPADQFHAEFFDAPAPAWRRGTVTAEFMDGYEDGSDVPLACWSDGSLWNGWAMPYMPKESVDKLIAAGVGPLAWDGNNVVAAMGDDVDDLETYLPLVIEGETTWGVGAGSWCWDAVEFDKEDK
jgi:hypothetical protein